MSERRILVVDDDPDLLETLRILLEYESDRRVTAVETASEARRLLASTEPFHLVISDLRIGEDLGIDLLRESQRLRPEVPRILLTGLSEDGMAKAGVQPTDADGVFQKDRLIIARKEFMAAVARLSGEEASEVAEDLTVPLDWWGLVPYPFQAPSPGAESFLPADWWGLLADPRET